MGEAILSELATEIVIPVCAVVGIVFSLVQWFLVSKVKLTPHATSSSSGNSNNNNSSKRRKELTTIASWSSVPTFKAPSPKSFATATATKLNKPSSSNSSIPLVPFNLIMPQTNWEADKMLDVYIHDYLVKRDLKASAQAFQAGKLSMLPEDFYSSGGRFSGTYLLPGLMRSTQRLPPHILREGLFEAITGYGLGGSSMALFGRVGGGIYTKAADVGADLVGKVERNIPEDDPRNPAVNADNVGDNVGDIAGMGSDLFGSYAESSCASLVVASISSFGIDHDFTAMLYPLLVSSVGILICLITTLFATDFFEIKAVKEIEPALKKQLIISTALMTIGIAIISWLALPSSFTIFNFGAQKKVKSWQLFLCVAVGLWAGLIIGFVTEYYTSNAYSPVQDVADSCRTGAATNVIFGLALGYKSVIIPIFAIAISIFVSFSFAAMYGIAVAALGMLSTIATGLAIDAYGPISDNAGGIAEMAGMSHRIRERTDALDAAGNTTAAIGKGFAIGSAALVSLALFGAFVSRAGISTVDVLTPKVFIGLLVGAMLPYWFSAMTMKSVGSAALKMVEEVLRQFNTIPGLMEGHAKPDYATCVKISTDASIKDMIPPGALVMLTPLIVGTFFGVETLSGVLAGALVSGVQIAISASNTGGAWDNAKKYIEAGGSEHARTLGPKDQHLLFHCVLIFSSFANAGPSKDRSSSHPQDNHLLFLEKKLKDKMALSFREHWKPKNRQIKVHMMLPTSLRNTR
ncbi:hypothetical protein AHAS_Ahas19G0018300 [Arachis hypogaea]